MVALVVTLVAVFAQNSGASRFSPIALSHQLGRPATRGLSPRTRLGSRPRHPMRAPSHRVQVSRGDRDSHDSSRDEEVWDEEQLRFRLKKDIVRKPPRRNDPWGPAGLTNWKVPSFPIGKASPPNHNVEKILGKEILDSKLDKLLDTRWDKQGTAFPSAYAKWNNYNFGQVDPYLDTRKLLQSWELSLWDSKARLILEEAYQGARPSRREDQNWKDTLIVLQKMESDITTLHGSVLNISSSVPRLYQRDFKAEGMHGHIGDSDLLDAVGLMPNNEFSNDESVTALAVFSRGELQDNSKFKVKDKRTSNRKLPVYPGSLPSPLLAPLTNLIFDKFSQGILTGTGQRAITGDSPKNPEAMSFNSSMRFQPVARPEPSPLLKMVEAQLGVRDTQGMLGIMAWRKTIPVFAIEGLAQAPDLSMREAKVLLAKIAEYAKSEQRLVVVARHAVWLHDGTDLTGYYMRLGFEKVEMNDGSYDLVYPGGNSGFSIASTMVILDPWVSDDNAD